MTTLHMDTEVVREAARQIQQTANLLDNHYNSLCSSINHLDWDGLSAQDYKREYFDVLKHLRDLGNSLDVLGHRVNTEAVEWEAVDRERPFGRWHDEKTSWGDAHDNIEFVSTIAQLGAMAYITANVSKGTSYAGQILFKGPKWVKELAGLSGSLTHSTAEGFAKNLAFGKKSKVLDGLQWGLAALEWGDKSIQDWHRYEKGSEKAAAIAVDGAFVVGKTVGGAAFQSWVMGSLGVAALGAMATAGAPAIAVVGVGFGIWWGSGMLFDWAADSLYDAADNAGIKDSIVQAGGKIIDGAVNLAGQAANATAKAVDSAYKNVVNGISNLFH